MNELQIFNNNEFGEIKTIEKENKDKYTGFFYVLEWDNFVKIGSTKNPYQRIMALKRNAETYGKSKLGRVAFSIPHTNYEKNERKLHKEFCSFRKAGSELFNISFDEIISNIPKDIDYLDESEEIDKKADIFVEGMKKFIFGGILDGRN